MLEVQKAHPLITLLQKIFSQLWNAGLFEDIDSLRGQFLSELSQKRSSKVAMELESLRIELMENSNHRHVQFKTSDDVLLDGMLFNKDKEKIILFVPGIGSFYEKMGQENSVPARFYSFFKDHLPDYSVFAFNSRGIGKSGGTFDLKNLPIDTASAYTYLTDVLGYDLDSILLYTHSLGGLHATQGAGLIQEKFPEAKLSAVNDRSFGELGTFTKAFLKNSSFGEMASNLVDKFGINLCAKTAWEMLKGQKIVIVSKYDRTIPYEKGAFCQFVDSGIIIHLEGLEKETNHHTRSFSTEEAKLIVSSILA